MCPYSVFVLVYLKLPYCKTIEQERSIKSTNYILEKVVFDDIYVLFLWQLFSTLLYPEQIEHPSYTYD